MGWGPRRGCRGRSRLLLGCLAGGLVTLLAGCSPPGSSEAPPPPPPDLRGPAEDATAMPSSGLKPLPAPDQVIGSVPLGRSDPFANVFPSTGPASPEAAGGAAPGATAAANSPAGPAKPAPPRPLQLPTGFRFSGVIRTGGRSEAVVQYRNLGGSLRPGDRGGISTDLLPRGWSVAAIDVQRGELTLQVGGRRVTAQL